LFVEALEEQRLGGQCLFASSRHVCVGPNRPISSYRHDCVSLPSIPPLMRRKGVSRTHETLRRAPAHMSGGNTPGVCVCVCELVVFLSRSIKGFQRDIHKMAMTRAVSDVSILCSRSRTIPFAAERRKGCLKLPLVGRRECQAVHSVRVLSFAVLTECDAAPGLPGFRLEGNQ